MEIEMKIAMIGHKRVPSREGGVEIVVEELAVRMARAGHSVTVYNRGGAHVAGGKTVRLKDYKGVRIKTVPTFRSKKLNAAVYSFFAAFRALFGGYDVIHFHAEGPCSMLWLPHLFGIHTVATVHGLDWQRSKWGGFASRFIKFGEKTAAKYADKIIVLSEGTKEYFMETYGRETEFIPNGAGRVKIKEPDIIKKKYGLEKDGYILFLARLVPEKGAHYLTEAFSGLDTDRKLVIAGGASHSEDYVRELRAGINDPRVIFTGFVEGDELWELYSNCRLYILPSDVEGMPLTLLEAMSCGCECLVSDIETAKNVLGEYGYTFRKGSAEDLREKIKEILKTPPRDKSAQKEYIRANYSWDAAASKTLELYKR